MIVVTNKLTLGIFLVLFNKLGVQNEAELPGSIKAQVTTNLPLFALIFTGISVSPDGELLAFTLKTEVLCFSELLLQELSKGSSACL